MNPILRQTCMEIPLLRMLGEPDVALGENEAGALVWQLEAGLGWALALAQVGGRTRRPLPLDPPPRKGAILARSATVEDHTGRVLAHQIQICLRGAASCRITPRWLIVGNGGGLDCERADLEFLLGLAADEGCEWLGCRDRERISRNPDCSIAFEHRLKRAGARIHVPGCVAAAADSLELCRASPPTPNVGTRVSAALKARRDADSRREGDHPGQD